MPWPVDNDELWGKDLTVYPPQPVVSVDIAHEWRPCVKLPITVHVREQRPEETHISTREGITPLLSDDLIMLGVQGEEYPIGRELFEQTYRLKDSESQPPADGEMAELVAYLQDHGTWLIQSGYADESIKTRDLGIKVFRAATLLRQQAAYTTPQPPAEGEVARFAAWLKEHSENALELGRPDWAHMCTRTADLLQRQHPQPVPVSERPWERGGWCDEQGRCWLRRKHEEDGVTWRLMPPASVFDDAMPIYYAEVLPANALPTP